MHKRETMYVGLKTTGIRNWRANLATEHSGTEVKIHGADVRV